MPNVVIITPPDGGPWPIPDTGIITASGVIEGVYDNFAAAEVKGTVDRYATKQLASNVTFVQDPGGANGNKFTWRYDAIASAKPGVDDHEIAIYVKLTKNDLTTVTLPVKKQIFYKSP